MNILKLIPTRRHKFTNSHAHPVFSLPQTPTHTVKPSDASQSFSHSHHKLRLHHTQMEYSLTMHPHFPVGPTLPFPQPLPPLLHVFPTNSRCSSHVRIIPRSKLSPDPICSSQGPFSFSQDPFASGSENKPLSSLHVARAHWTRHWNPRMLSRLYNNLDRFLFSTHTNTNTTSHCQRGKQTNKMASNTLFSVLSMLLLLFLRPSSAAHDYHDALRKSILFFEGQRSGRLPADQRLRWRRDSALHDGATAGVRYSFCFLCSPSSR